MMPSSRPSAALEMLRLLRAGGPELDSLAGLPTVADFRARARRRLPKMAFDFIDGSAGLPALAGRAQWSDQKGKGAADKHCSPDPRFPGRGFRLLAGVANLAVNCSSVGPLVETPVTHCCPR